MDTLSRYFIILMTLTFVFSCAKKPADLILTNGDIYTMDAENPWASIVVITGNKISAVLNDSNQINNFKGPHTRIINLEGRFVVPGFIDGHVHFNRAGSLINDANLMAVSDDEGLKAEMARVVSVLDDGEWITGG